jgi:hypothetical protein
VFKYAFEHTLGIFQHIVIPESQDEIPHRLQDSCSIGIPLSVRIVLSAIDLHDELRIRAAEVDNEPIDRYLSLEFPAREPAVAQAKPQHALGVGLIA